MRTLRFTSLMLCATVASLGVTAAMGQNYPPPIAAAVQPGGIWDTINDGLFTLTMAIIPIVASAIGFYVRKFVGERAASIVQDMIQNAGERAAAGALAKAGITKAETPAQAAKATEEPVVQDGVDYLRTKMADTFKKVGVDVNTPAGDNTLRDIVLANIGKLIIGATQKKD